MTELVLSQSSRQVFSDYLSLTKPRIALLVLVTTAASFWVASKGALSLSLLIATLVGTGLASAAASVFNCVLDREIDARMERTRQRPLAAGRLGVVPAMLFGVALTLGSFLILALGVNLLAAGLALFAIFFYSVVYTLWLKRTSPWCTEIGGMAGAIPPVIGWAAATGQVEAPALVLFAILFLWQPPHFWALALTRVEEYRRAGLPILPVVKGERVTRRRSLLYALALVPTSLVLFYPLGVVGWGYALGAGLLGVGFLSLSWRSWAQPSAAHDKKLFFYSMIYLALLFLLVFLAL
ncbi:MAG: heme o synthase [Candidatus Bipolaricaulota bacterium]|nr:heme o synthase [Candidatus Bipolaricaulota bacterium]MCS7275352.1 heme o synthase [Candidatus Bipolaricaulota bacterium]MDW8110149.1 heme o synthase [Candidatus Bipolaricaulota bacterium]